MKYLTVKEYAEHRRVSRATLYTWINIKEFPSVKQGARRVIDSEKADLFVDSGGLKKYAKSRRSKKF